MQSSIVEQDVGMLLDYFSMNDKQFVRARLRIATVFALLIILLGLIFDNVLLLFFSPVFAYLGWKLPYLRLKMAKRQQDILVTHQFPRFLRYFISLFQTNETVFQTLQATLLFLADSVLKVEVEKLVDTIRSREQDTSSAFMAFANFIGTSEAQLVMSFLYEFDHYGIQKDELLMLEQIVNEMQVNTVNELCLYKENRISKYASWAIVTALVFVFSFVFSVFYYYTIESLANI